MARRRFSGRSFLMVFLTLFSSPGLPQESAGAAPGVEVTLSARDRAKLAKPVPVEVTAVARWFGKEKVEPVPFILSPGKPASIHLRPGRWVVEAKAPGTWIAPLQLEVQETPLLAALDLWPAGELQGELAWEGDKPPSDLAIFFRPAPGVAAAEAPPIAQSSCAVDLRTWRCALPAGKLDLRFQASGFVPRYEWGVTVEPGRALRPGRLQLRQGSAVQGWVVTADNTPVGEGGKVTLRPRISGAVRDPGERKRLESLRFEAPINPRGFFQIESVPAGAYLLEARQERFAPAVVSVRVVPGETTEISHPPLLLDVPKRVEVFIDPPVDPAGHAWLLKLQRLDRDSSVIESFAEGAAALDGAWRQSGVPPGRYLLRISSGGQVWWANPVQVDEDLAPVQVRLDVVTVQGTVQLGKKPLPAKIAFGGKSGAIRVEAQADEEGRFQAVLPRRGNWPVFISAVDPMVLREIPKLEIQPKPGTHEAEVEIRLPDTVLRGQVVDEANAPVDRALVSAMSDGEVKEDLVQAWTDKEGRFEIRGLLPGSTLLKADAGEDRTADPVHVDVEDGQDEKSWILVLRPQLRVSGIVSSSFGPVPGARIRAAPAGLPYLSVPLVTSDAQGHFEVRLPRAAKEIHLSVGAPGFAFRMLRLPVPESRFVGLNLDQAAGTLIVEKEADLDFLDPGSPMIYILHGSSFVGIAQLMGWAVQSGAPTGESGQTVVPSLEPGPYQACLVLPQERPGLDFGILPQSRCVSGSLNPNGELTLKVPG